MFRGGGTEKCQVSGSLPLPSQGPRRPHSEGAWGLSNVPGSTLQAQMSLDVQIGALSPWSSSLPLSLPPSHPRPARKPSRVARKDSQDRTGWAPRPPDDRLLQKMKHCRPAGDSARPGPGRAAPGGQHSHWDSGQARTLFYFSISNILAITKINSTEGDRSLYSEAKGSGVRGGHCPGNKLGSSRAGGAGRCRRGLTSGPARGRRWPGPAPASAPSR